MSGNNYICTSSSQYPSWVQVDYIRQWIHCWPWWVCEASSVFGRTWPNAHGFRSRSDIMKACTYPTRFRTLIIFTWNSLWFPRKRNSNGTISVILFTFITRSVQQELNKKWINTIKQTMMCGWCNNSYKARSSTMSLSSALEHKKISSNWK